MLRETTLDRWIAAVAAALLVFGVVQCVLAGQRSHPDHEVYRAAAAAFRAGADPYLVTELERFGADHGLLLPYPPLATAMLHLLVDHRFGVVALVYAACLVFTFLLGWAVLRARGIGPGQQPIVSLWRHGLQLAAWLASGFAAARWNFQTGNLGLVELLIFAVALWALRQSRHLLFASAIGILGFLKLVPLVLLLLLLPAVFNRRVKAYRLLLPVLVFASLHLLSWQLYPELTTSWLRNLFGGVEGQHTPWHEWTSGNANPTFVLLLMDLVVLDAGIGLGDGIAVLLLAAAAFVFLRLAQSLVTGRDDAVTGALLVLALLLLWPRLKPYSYGYALLPLALCVTSIPPRISLLLLCGCAGLPMVMPWMPNPPTDALLLVKRNHLAVLLLFAGFVLAGHLRWRSNGPATPGIEGFRSRFRPEAGRGDRTGDPPVV